MGYFSKKTMVDCKICNRKTGQIISFGKMPIANSFKSKIVEEKVLLSNLSLAFCPFCLMVQLEETVASEILYSRDYPFISSTSNVMANHFEKMAQEIIRKIYGKKKPFVVELGCNDGILLKHIAVKKINHLGIEPAGNVARLAEKNNVKVLCEFFNKKTAMQIVKKHGKADVIAGANVISHIENLNSVFEGLKILLKKNGYFIFEDPYLYDILEKSSFDQIYDEHIYYFSGLSIMNLALKYGFQLVNMKHQNVHGGSMRYYLQKSEIRNPKSEIKRWVDKEKKMRLDKIDGYLGFKNRVDKTCFVLKQTLFKIKKSNKRIVGYGATSKSTTLLNYLKIGPEIIDYIVDITPTKIDKYTPGTNISIKSRDFFIADNPAYVLLLAWNHKKEIFQKEKKYRQKGGKFILYFPKILIE